MVTNGCKKFELPASIATGIAKHNTEGNNEFPIPLLYNLCCDMALLATPRPGLGGQLPLDILPRARPRGTTAPGYFIPPSPLRKPSYIILLYPNDEDPTRPRGATAPGYPSLGQA